MILAASTSCHPLRDCQITCFFVHLLQPYLENQKILGKKSGQNRDDGELTI
jgi:hypothetical protein